MVKPTFDYYFDGQLRRYTMQVIRVFSEFVYQTERRLEDGSAEFRPFTCRHAIADRQVAAAILKNSGNTAVTLPLISVHLADIEHDRSDMRAPGFHESRVVHQQAVDAVTGLPVRSDQMGERYQLDRITPSPVKLTYEINVFWTNQLQRDQFFEQYLTIFNPSIDLNITGAPYDWASLTILENRSIRFQNRGFPAGNNTVEYSTVTLEIRGFINSPGYLRKAHLINQVVANILDSDNFDRKTAELGLDVVFGDDDLISRVVVTPGQHHIRYADGKVYLLGPNGVNVDAYGAKYQWRTLLDAYGALRSGVSQIHLRHDENPDSVAAVRGTFEYTAAGDALTFVIDPFTVPTPDLSIDAVVDPHAVWPGSGLPLAAAGQKYVVASEIGDSNAWGEGLRADANDIVVYDALVGWKVFWTAANTLEGLKALNTKTNQLLYWNGAAWVLYLEAEYAPGMWRIFL